MVHLNFMASQLYWESSELLHIGWSQGHINSVYNRLRTKTRIIALTFPWFRIYIMFLTAGDSGESFWLESHRQKVVESAAKFSHSLWPFIDCFMPFPMEKKWKMHFCLVILFTIDAVLKVNDVNRLSPSDIYWLTRKGATLLPISFHDFLLNFACPQPSYPNLLWSFAGWHVLPLKLCKYAVKLDGLFFFFFFVLLF